MRWALAREQESARPGDSRHSELYHLEPQPPLLRTHSGGNEDPLRAPRRHSSGLFAAWLRPLSLGFLG